MKKLLLALVFLAGTAQAQNNICIDPLTGYTKTPFCTNEALDVNVAYALGAYSEDSLHVNGDPGISVFARRMDTVASSAATDENHSVLNSDSNGRLYVQASLQSSTISQAGTDRTVKYAAINIDGADSDQIIAAVASRKIKVLGYVIVCDGATTITFEDGDGTDVTGAMALAANGGISAAVSALGYFVTPTANKSLKILKSAAVSCDGHITYAEVI